MSKPSFREILKQKVLLFDGAMGTEIQKKQLTAADFGGQEGFNDYLVVTRPDIILGIHESYLAAGADCVETNTFGSSRLKLEEYGKGEEVFEVNKKAAELARQACEKFASAEKPRYVVGSMGPTGMLPSSTDPALSKITFDELEQIYWEQSVALIAGGVDALLIETSQDILEVRAAIIGSKRAIADCGRDVFLISHVTLDQTGRMLLGTDIASAATTMYALKPDGIGLNCSTGPAEMIQTVQWICQNIPLPISIVPNAGMPENINGIACYRLQPEPMADLLMRFVAEFGVNMIGGCCGTAPEYIQVFAQRLQEIPFKSRDILKADNMPRSFLSSGMAVMDLQQEPAPTLIGERLNTQGSKKAKEYVLNQNFDELTQLARQQSEDGAHLLDVCVALTERADEKETMCALVKMLSASVPNPLVIDSTEVDVIEAALKIVPGRCMINSINLEGDGSRLHKLAPLMKKYGVPAVAMTIDELGMAKTRERKVEAAQKIYDLCIGQYGLSPDQLVFDVLTFTLATGEDEFKNSALETIEGIRLVKEKFPGVFTTLGLSNVSFGLKPAARKVLNCVFLYYCVKAGLDTAIVNAKETVPYSSLTEKERQLAEDLIFNKVPDALPNFILYYEENQSGGTTVTKKRIEVDPSWPAEKKIHFCIVNRIKDQIEEYLNDCLKSRTAVQVINDILLPAMKEVGDKFGAGELILPFVLQSAEVMKKAVAHVEQFLDKSVSVKKGRLVLATVYGDVHDIGKNLVKTVFSNNGYEVYDLGKQVPVNTIIEKAKEVNADAIGLSALLVSTSKQMQFVVEELSRQGLTFPVIVGGAAINSAYSRRISILIPNENKVYEPGVMYANDAFGGLDVMTQLMDPAQRKLLLEKYKVNVLQEGQKPERKVISADASKHSGLKPLKSVPKPPFWGRMVLKKVDLQKVYPFLDMKSLINLSWGIRGEQKKEFLESGEFDRLLKEYQQRAIAEQWFEPVIIWGYWPTQSEGNQLIVYDPEQLKKDKKVELFRLDFPRQNQDEHLCFADYFLPSRYKKMDVLPMQVVTVGHKVSRLCEELNAQEKITEAYYLHGFASEMAEALAAYNHSRIRKELGLEAGRGQRYSYGYPILPDLTEQKKMWQILQADKEGIHLTEACQINPDQSTSALIVHHPEAKYFTMRLETVRAV